MTRQLPDPDEYFSDIAKRHNFTRMDVIHDHGSRRRLPEIQIEKLRSILTYDPDAGSLTWINYHNLNGKPAGQIPKNNGPGAGYREVGLFGYRFGMHRICWALHYGEWPDRSLDHVNGVKHDNRISNLRLATPAENVWNRNRPGSNKTGYTGVSEVKAGWKAKISHLGTVHDLGVYQSPEDAYTAYCKASVKLRGEFAPMSHHTAAMGDSNRG